MYPNFKNFTKNEGCYPDGSYFIEYYYNKGNYFTRWIYDDRICMWCEYYQDNSYYSAGNMLRGRTSNNPLKPRLNY